MLHGFSQNPVKPPRFLSMFLDGLLGSLHYLNLLDLLYIRLWNTFHKCLIRHLVPFLSQFIGLFYFCFLRIILSDFQHRKIYFLVIKDRQLRIILWKQGIDIIHHINLSFLQKCSGLKLFILRSENITLISLTFLDDIATLTYISGLIQDFLLCPYMLSVFIIEHISCSYLFVNHLLTISLRKDQMYMIIRLCFVMMESRYTIHTIFFSEPFHNSPEQFFRLQFN
ncbi:MAG: hypothetical protein BWY61_01869 [Firmicutes bacterium ADurb.Bin354]|nr:MAG: hypothetical protein BWY61_01869 [Firmicutes bacterium ADurb.Bin354]